MSSVKLILQGCVECELTTSDCYWFCRSLTAQSAEERNELEMVRTRFLASANPDSWTTDAFVMHHLRGLLTECRDGYVLYKMDDHAVARAVVLAVESRRLVAVEVKRRNWNGVYTSAGNAVSRSNTEINPNNLVDTAKPARQSPSHTPNDSAPTKTPLGDALPFEYTEYPASSTVQQVAGAEGTPGNNQAQNKQFRAVVRVLGLNKDQAQELHQEISKQGLGYHEIMQRAIDMFGGQ